MRSFDFAFFVYDFYILLGYKNIFVRKLFNLILMKFKELFILSTLSIYLFSCSKFEYAEDPITKIDNTGQLKKIKDKNGATTAEFFYDDYGRLVKMETRNVPGNTSFARKNEVLKVIEAKRNINKGVESTSKVNYALATGAVDSYRKFTYTPSGALQSIVSYYYNSTENKLMRGDSSVYVADSQGKVISGKLWYFYDDAPETPELIDSETYYYDAQGQLTKIKYEFVDYPDSNYEDVFTYANGNIVPKALISDNVGGEKHEVTRTVKYDNHPNVVSKIGLIVMLATQSDDAVLYLSKNNVLENVDGEKFIAQNGSSRTMTIKATSVYVYGEDGKPFSQEVINVSTANIYGNINTVTTSYKHYFEYVK